MSQSRAPLWVKVFIAQGVVAPLLFAFVAIVGGAMHPGYSHVNQAISELTATGMENRRVLNVGLFTMEMQTALFGIGVYWASRDLNRQLRWVGAVFVLIGVVGLFYPWFPMDVVGTPMTDDGRMHLVIVSISAVLAMAGMLLAGIGWAKVLGGRWMARFSYGVFAVMLASGIISAIIGVQGWPGIGIWQRVNTGFFSLWQIVCAIVLLRRLAMPK